MNGQAMDGRKRAKQILVFYFTEMFKAVGQELTWESQQELENLVDCLIDEAVDIAIEETLNDLKVAIKNVRTGDEHEQEKSRGSASDRPGREPVAKGSSGKQGQLN